MNVLNSLLEKYKVQPVGNGYIDCIIAENIEPFIGELENLHIAVTGVSWWYFCKNGSKNIPSLAMGGPKSKYYNGWFAEMNVGITEFCDCSNEKVIEYLTNGVKKEKFYNENLVPGLWLSVDELSLK